jgi:hypothetical protein
MNHHRPWVPMREPHPTCQPVITNWPALLMRLFPESIVDGMRVKEYSTHPRFRSSYDPRTKAYFRSRK